MSVRLWFAPFVFTLGLVSPLTESPATSSPGPTEAATQDPPAGAGQDQTTLDDQVDLAVTVYNSDIALVRDVRNLRLARGVSELRFMDIAATVNPATVHFRSLSDRKCTVAGLTVAAMSMKRRSDVPRASRRRRTSRTSAMFEL